MPSASNDDDWLRETWRRKRRSLIERVDLVLRATSHAEPADADMRAARSASHELAGTVGLFDVPRAGALSVELDGQICTGALVDEAGRARVRRIAEALRAALDAGV